MSLAFDAASHTYRWNGQRVPSVTSVLSPLVNYNQVPWAVLERARLEGVAIHKTIELYLHNDLESLPQWLQPRLDAFKKFQAESQFVVDASERKVYHTAHQYAGTLDLSGVLNDEHSIIDIKRSFFAGAAIGVQLAAYQEAENDRRKREKLPKIKRRYALQLMQNGNYKLECYDDSNDFAVFLALLTLKKWRSQHEQAD